MTASGGVEDVRFEYKLLPGSGEARLQVGAATAELTAPDVGDPLRNLLRAMLALAHGAPEVRVSWWEEPGEYRWVLNAPGRPVDVWILWFDDDSGKAQNADGQELLRASCARRSLVQAVAAGAQAVLDEHGLSGYRKLWDRNDFPAEDLKELQVWLTQG